MQSASPFDDGGYPNGLYPSASASLNFDGSGAMQMGATVKVHHGSYENEPCYNMYAMGRPAYLPRDPPPYPEAAAFHASFGNQTASYYKPPASRPSDLLDYGVDSVSTTSAGMRLADSYSSKADIGAGVPLDTFSRATYGQVSDVGKSVAMGGLPGAMAPPSERADNRLANSKMEPDTSNPSMGYPPGDFLSLPTSSTPSPPESSSRGEGEGKREGEESQAEGGGEGKEAPKEGQDGEKGSETKPPLSYIALIAKAILESPTRRLNLASIYSWIEGNYPYYLKRGQGWRNSVRHNLSLNDCFIKNGRCEDGKGNYWAIHPANLEDFMRGDFRQRRRSRRRGRNKKEAELSMFMTPAGYLPPGSPALSHQMAFNPTASYPFPYTDAERVAYKLDDIFPRQPPNHPFAKYHSHTVNGMSPSPYTPLLPQGSSVNPGMYGSADTHQWGQGYGDQPPSHTPQAFYPPFARNYSAPTLS